MFEYQDERISVELMTIMAEDFLDRHPVVAAADVYRWLWEGEFGAGTRRQPANLDDLMLEIRQGRMHKVAGKQTMWEFLGLSRRYLHVNLLPFSDAGCPLRRILNLSDRGRDFRGDALRFKAQWGFMKTQVVPGMKLTIEEMNAFEAEIPFHMTPEMHHTPDFIREYGQSYMVVPFSLFLEHFPEYDTERG